MTSLTVLVPTYKRPEDLRGFLACVRPQIVGRADRSLIVVNDGTHDESYAAVLAEHDGWFTYIAKPQNGGPAAARNFGAQAATGDFIVFTDDDCRAPPHWLDYLQARLEAAPWLDGIAGYTRPVMEDPKSLRERMIANSAVLPGATYDEVGRLICAVTAAFAVRRSFFVRVGGFDETFRPSGEDLDLTQRVIRAGAILDADSNWWTGHTTADTIKSYLKRYYTYGMGSARYAMTRRDWTHPDVRNYATPEVRARTVAGWVSGLKGSRKYQAAGWLERAALRWFTGAVAREYARGYAEGAEKFCRPGAEPPTEAWMLWPRLGYAADGLPRR